MEDLITMSIFGLLLAYFRRLFNEGSSASVTPVNNFLFQSGTFRISGFNYRDPRNPDHVGIDIVPSNQRGQAQGQPIFSPIDGYIFRGVDRRGNSGNFATLRWQNLVSGGDRIFMCHLEDSPEYRTNRPIRKGELVGYIGQSGHAVGAHLHLQINLNNEWVNPLIIPEIRDFLGQQVHLHA